MKKQLKIRQKMHNWVLSLEYQIKKWSYLSLLIKLMNRIEWKPQDIAVL